MICLLVQNDPRVSFNFLCTFFCNAFGKIPNQIAHNDPRFKLFTKATGVNNIENIAKSLSEFSLFF